MEKFSRRQFALMTAAGVAQTNVALAQRGKITAGEVVDRIKKNIGVPWNDSSYRDTFKTGGPDSLVTGICSSFMSTLDVLQRSHKAGLNMIISHEPTFWSDADRVEPLKDDPLYKLKSDFARRNNLVVWRIHDHWHAHKPDGIFVGWNKALGWEQYLDSSDQQVFNIPPSTLREVARYVAKVLGTRSVRVIGDPDLRVARVGRGSHDLNGNAGIMARVDCALISEAREYDSFEYLRDVTLSGQKKGAIIIAHEAGEEAGMDYFAQWLRPFVPEVPVQFIPTRDDFWTV